MNWNSVQRQTSAMAPATLLPCVTFPRRTNLPASSSRPILPRGTSTHHALLEMAAKWRDAGVQFPRSTPTPSWVAKPKPSAACASARFKPRGSLGRRPDGNRPFRDRLATHADGVSFPRRSLAMCGTGSGLLMEKRFEDKGFVGVVLGRCGLGPDSFPRSQSCIRTISAVKKYSPSPAIAANRI